MQTIISNRIFKYYDAMWMAPLELEACETTFEVYNSTINTELVTNILSKVDNDSIQQLYKEAASWLENLSLSFWKKDLRPEFILTGITIGLNESNKDSDFLLCYHMISKIDTFSDYANWLVDIRDFKIIGCRREQL